jgi:DHA2 family multidrug resistance protein-like MFS transporter
VFLTAIPFSLIALSLSHALPDPTPRKHSFDVLGAALCAVTFGLVIAGLEGAIHSPHLLLSLGIVGVGAVVGWFFVRHELGEAEPVLPVDLLKLPPIALSTISCFAAILGSITLMLFMPFRLQHTYGFTPGQVGGVLSAYAIGSLMCAPIAGMLSDRIAVPLLSTIGMTIAAIALLCIALLPAQPSQFDVIWRIWLCGVGFGIFSSPNARFIVASAPVTRTASAGSIYSTTRMLSQAIGATLVAALLALGLGNGPVPALVAMGLACVAGVISASSLRSTNATPLCKTRRQFIAMK